MAVFLPIVANTDLLAFIRRDDYIKLEFKLN
jgi:hypothetical protein